jgi:hypothetical protein
MEIHIIHDDTDVELPVLPESFELSGGTGNEQVTIHTVGEVTLIGKPKLSDINISTEFPAAPRSYLNIAPEELQDPYWYVDTFKEWKNQGYICRLVITSTNIASLVTIEGFTYGEDDSTGDVGYTLELKEYREHEARKLKVTKKRTSKKTSKTYKVKKGDTLKKIAKKKMGKTKYSKKLYSANKKVIEAAWKKYRKKKNQEIKKWNRKHPHDKKSLIKDRTSKKGKHLVVGTKLKIPKV